MTESDCKTEWDIQVAASTIADWDKTEWDIQVAVKLAAAEAAYIEAVRLHNLTLDELRVSESENFHADAHKLALALEMLLMSTTDDSACAKLWDMAHEALEQHRQLVDEIYPQEYVSAFGKN